MTRRVRSRNGKSGVDEALMPQSSQNTESSADKIRQFILSHYIVPARNRGEKTVTVKAGNIHTQMLLRGQHANVCQVMRGDKLLHLANAKLKSFKGPPAGANAYFTYQL